MNRGFCIAGVSFLNTVPLLDGLGEDRDGVDRLILDLPSRLVGLLAAGKADAALVPIAEILRGATGGIVAPVGIACDGPVGSVMLFTAGDPGGLRRILADRGSRSSVVLLQILLAELYRIRPAVEFVEPRPGARLHAGEGLLIIGDRCFAQQAALLKENPDGVRGLDLGGLWRDLTGLPFVFAAWAASPDLVAARGRLQAARLGRILTEAARRGCARLAVHAREQAAAGQLGLGGEAGAAAIERYFREALRFFLGPRERQGIRKFQELGRRHEVLPDAGEPVWLNQGAQDAV